MQNVVKNQESLTLKQMFDVTAQLVNNQEEINCLDKILYQKNSWTHLSLCSQILCCVSAKFVNIKKATKFGTELQEFEPRKASEIMMLSVEC